MLPERLGEGGEIAIDRSPSSDFDSRTRRTFVIRSTSRQRSAWSSNRSATDFELINPLGETVPREAYIDSGDAFAYTAWKPISPIRVRVHGDSAVIRYESEIELHGTRGHYWHTDLYEKRNGQWQAVWSQTTGAA